jgi:adenylate cyclase
MGREFSRRRRRSKPPQPERLLESVRQTDSKPELVATARFLRRLLPGSTPKETTAPKGGGKVSRRLGRLVSDLDPDRPSAVRELGLGAMEAWRTLSDAQRRRRGQAEVAILFTDLVGFSEWALGAGDEVAVELLGEVEAVEEDAVRGHGGVIVKRLGDGSMAVFSEADDAVAAGLEALTASKEVRSGRYRATLRAGVHLGRPRKVDGDFLGIDVNIAARVADAAEGDELLASDAVREATASSGFRFGRRRELTAPGAPEDLSVHPVRGYKRTPQRKS